MADNQTGLGEVLFEFRKVGAQVRVAALHAKTGIEITIVAPANAPRSQMQKIALAKLRRRLEQDGRI